MDRIALMNALAAIMELSTGEAVDAVEETMSLREDLNLDSMDFMTMVIEVQREFRIELPSTDFTDVVLVKDLLDLIQRKLATAKTVAA